MFMTHFLFALVFALMMVALFAILFRARGPWNNLMWFFVIVLLATWAGGIWLTPMGPSLKGYYWLPFLIVGFLVTLLLAAASMPLSDDETTVELVDQDKRKRHRRAAGLALGAFFWVLLVVLIIAIIFRYFL